MNRTLRIFLVLVFLLSTFQTAALAATNDNVGINIVLNQPINNSILKDLGAYGKVRNTLNEINAVTLSSTSDKLPAIQSLPYVEDAAIDQEINMPPLDTVPMEDFSDGISTWDLDAINVTDYGAGRTIGYDGSGVYVAVIDTGLVANWQMFFPQERVATQYAKAFGGGGAAGVNTTDVSDKWQHDTNSHGTHVTSTIIGYNLRGKAVNGVAPMATIIPVKVLNQNGSAFDSVVAAGILYVANLKAGALANSPVVINMSLGGSGLDPIEKAAIDYAINVGVLVVASAGNEGAAGMGYPGAYEPVISVAAAGSNAVAANPGLWQKAPISDPTNASEFYIADFSSVQLTGQDLDVAAPGDLVVGPYQVSFGSPTYYYLSGTSMAAPHVTGTVALMAQRNPALKQADAETILENSALSMPEWGQTFAGAGLIQADAALKATH